MWNWRGFDFSWVPCKFVLVVGVGHVASIEPVKMHVSAIHKRVNAMQVLNKNQEARKVICALVEWTSTLWCPHLIMTGMPYKFHAGDGWFTKTHWDVLWWCTCHKQPQAYWKMVCHCSCPTCALLWWLDWRCILHGFPNALTPCTSFSTGATWQQCTTPNYASHPQDGVGVCAYSLMLLMAASHSSYR